MDKLEALKTLMDISQSDIKKLETGQLRDILGALRCVTRQFEREVNKRDMESGKFMA